ncbi:hypothetical protein ZWY2020_045874 [Hordeum vulgare]|nr:hypothetical protein ZWY2020_045872 [Hordeum vulgare]KAI4968544.1 hypothetical protein ZWY2020_045874 [Hordeum vulgare]
MASDGDPGVFGEAGIGPEIRCVHDWVPEGCAIGSKKTLKYSAMKDMASIKKERVRKIILATISCSDLPTKLELVDTLQRTGVAYHFGKEIQELLRGMQDVFLKFRDDRGNFASNDVKSLLALYNAAYLRTQHLEPWFAEEVRCIETPSFRRAERVETRRYIPVYEKKTTRDEDILEFAKIDFNILQTLYCEELKALPIWWKDFKSQTDLKFARDRMVELHFWILGVVYEPQYSYSRAMLTKLIIFELYINILNTTNDIEEELKRHKNKNAEMIKELLIHMAKCYHAEVKWRDEHYIPTSVEEHLQISVRSSACMQITSFVFISLGDVTTREVLEWVLTYPKIIRSVCIVGRIGSDMVSHEREQITQHVVSTVQTSTKEHGITIGEANDKLKVIIEEARMDIVHECLHKKQPMVLLEKATDLA